MKGSFSNTIYIVYTSLLSAKNPMDMYQSTYSLGLRAIRGLGSYGSRFIHVQYMYNVLILHPLSLGTSL